MSIKLQLWFLNPVAFTGGRAGENLLGDIVWYVINMVWNKVVTADVLTVLRFVAPEPSLLFRFRFGQWVVLLSDGFVIGKRTDGYRKKLSPFSRFGHVGDDFFDQSFVFVLGVALVKNAVLSVGQSAAPKTVFRR